MRPLRLELAAFGPFADMEVVDFRELGERRLFLVHGPTGAGKTTLLDAICFALYGDATGPERDGKGFRSQFAGPECTTEVTLDFAVGARRYRVNRRPEQERAKLRGAGTTTSPAAATLWDRSGLGEDEPGEGRVLASRVTQVNEAVAGILGFRSEQFRQVIVLPQGRFRELLLARSQEREEILRQLFDTAFYGRIEEALKRHGRGLQAEAARLRNQRVALLAQEDCADAAALAARRGECIEARAAAAERLEALQAESALASQALEQARSVAAEFERLADAETTLGQLRELGPEMSQRQDQLADAKRAAGLEEFARRLVERRDAAAAAMQAAEQRAQEHAAASEAHQRMQAALAAEQARERGREALRARLAALDQALPLVTELVALLEQAERLGGQRDEARAALARVRSALAEARDAEATLRSAREAGSAALLARQLRPGEPCPVCGSTEHPRPAKGTQEIPDATAIAAAAAAVQAAERRLEGAQSAAVTADRSSAALEAEIGALRRQLAGRVETTPRGLRAIAAEAEAARRSLEAGRQAMAEAVAAERESKEQTVALATARAGAGEQRAVAEQALAETAGEWARRLEAAGFASEQAFRAARLDTRELTALEQRLADHDRQLAAAQARLAAACEAVGDRPRPDLSAAEDLAQQALTAWRQAADETGRLGARADALSALLERVQALECAHAAAEARYRVMGALAAAAAGDNPQRISLQRFVLASRLDEVLAAASQRFSLMSRGRYLLRRAVTAADRRSAGGLELEVEDAYTASTRPVATLSGGESFQAALSLALGLSEVVQAHAGGIRLDAIFIDEGFGSLDPEALDLAIDALLDLQQSGRLVGVISHVPELRERIDVRLEVLASIAGSRTVFRLP